MIPIAAPHRGTNRLDIETRKSRAGFSVVSQRHACRFKTSAPLLHFKFAEGHDAVANVGNKMPSGGIGDSEEASERGRTMKLRSQTVRAFHQSRPIVPCAQCGEALFAPEWSEYFDDHRIRHFWSCDSCDYQFETMVSYPATDAQAA
jgi:hypothetical protein